MLGYVHVGQPTVIFRDSARFSVDAWICARQATDWQTSSSESGLRADLLPLSRQLALQPEHVLQKYEREDAFYYVGWCRGRKPDLA